MQLQNAVVEEPKTEGDVPTLHRHDCTEIDRDADPVARDWRGSVCGPGAWPCPDCLGDDLVAVPKSGIGRCFHSRPCSTVVGPMESYRFRRRDRLDDSRGECRHCQRERRRDRHENHIINGRVRRWRARAAEG
jgi:hypothetical protein